MLVTLRVSDDRYIDVDIRIQDRIIVLCNPIPDLTRNQAQYLADLFHYAIVLPITEEVINPSVPLPPEAEIKCLNTLNALKTLLLLCNITITND